MCSMTSQGSPYSIFRKALLRGDLPAIRAAAADLPAVPLDDALEIVCLILAQQPERFERAAVKWLVRLLSERPPTGLRDVERVVACLATLPDARRGRAALAVLSALAGRRPGGSPPPLS
jgi:hypothetical protein